ncbi:helix-turn-helix domain-containing protein [Streptomyces sp. NPDC048638]|uniref:helix-turn-helix domain-containing protein n=1 Tax=Streptomyces sp. NPDC048638 TaxID=3365580 RepID=UPI003713C9C8
MPRQFDGSKVRAVRRGKEISQKQLGAHKGVGVSGPAVARWESGADFPKGEKLPAIADALGEPIDELFPYEGPADLQLLRCDAELSVAQAAEVIGTSRVPISNAESGRRRLQDAYVGPLSLAYDVTEQELLAAQDVSFGIQPPRSSHAEDRGALRTLGEKINYLLQHGYAEGTAPSDEQIAGAVNDHGCVPPITAADVAALRTGATTDAPDSVRAGLAHALDADVGLFQDSEELGAEARRFLESVRFIKTIQDGVIVGLAARSNDTGLSTELMARVNEAVAAMKNQLPDAEGES